MNDHRDELRHYRLTRTSRRSSSRSSTFNGYAIALPPAIPKGGKWLGKTEYLYAATLRGVGPSA